MAERAQTRVMRAVGGALLVAVVLGGCAGGAPAPNEHVASYVDRALELMGRYGLFVDEGWQARVDLTRQATQNASTTEETYGALALALNTAGGRHSALLPPSSGEHETSVDAPVPSAAMVSDHIGLLVIPSIGTTDRHASDEYVSAALASIDSLRDSARCGWIVDLRDNMGGNAYPMLLAVQPFLDGGSKIASFIDRNGHTEQLRYDGTAVMLDTSTVATAPSSIEPLDSDIVVLQNSLTASAAELVVIALADRPNGAIVGGPSAGFTTGNQTFALSDGALLVVTTAFDVGPSGRVFDGPIEPTVVRQPNQSHVEAAVSRLESNCRSVP